MLIRGCLGLSGGSRGAVWGALGALLGFLGHSRGSLGSLLGPSWGCLGSLLCALGAALGSLGHLGPKKANFGSVSGLILEPKICIWLVFFVSLVDHLLVMFLEHFWGLFWEQIGARRGQNEPKRAIKSFKVQKSVIFKNLKKPSVVQGFWGPETSQESLRRRKRAPKRHPKSPEASKTIFGQIRAPFCGFFWEPKLLQN